MVGGFKPDGELAARARAMGLAEQVRCLGHVERAELAALFRGAAAFVYPTLYEGFGLPVLEAMACGVPVVAGDVPAIQEVAGDAVVRVNPRDVVELAAAVRRVLEQPELQRQLRERGRAARSRLSVATGGGGHARCVPRGPGGVVMRVALVHDWLTGMRGGEAVLAEIASFFPGAPIFTLFHRKGAIEGELTGHPIRTSVPAALLVRRPRSTARFCRSCRRRRPGSSSRRLRPDHLVEPLRGQGRDPAAGRGARLLLPHADALPVGPARGVHPPRTRRSLRPMLRSQLERLRTWDVVSSARVDHFVANSRLVARRIERYWRREAEVIPPPVDTDFFTPGRRARCAPPDGGGSGSVQEGGRRNRGGRASWACRCTSSARGRCAASPAVERAGRGAASSARVSRERLRERVPPAPLSCSSPTSRTSAW